MTNQNAPQITTRQLREILFHIENQEMTVRQLRAMLFNETNQDQNLDVKWGMFSKLEAEQKAQDARLAALETL